MSTINLSCPDALMRCGRPAHAVFCLAAKTGARRPLACMGAKRIHTDGKEKDVFKRKQANACQLLNLLRFADLVVMAGRLHPFPFRTRP